LTTSVRFTFMVLPSSPFSTVNASSTCCRVVGFKLLRLRGLSFFKWNGLEFSGFVGFFFFRFRVLGFQDF
jgi:hypothetical protein